MDDSNSYKIDKKYAKHYGFLVVVACLWVAVNVWFITSWNRLPAVGIITAVLYYPTKKYADKKYPLTELTDSEKQIDVTISLEEYKKLREMRNAEHDKQVNTQDEKVVNFRKHGE
ncbi:hypothetical protein BZJ19_11640 [Salinivibrio proteolyticus]|uniref:hypothetical protein n=1 Tax=Salinivibrio proteolyticus TaxID=334715 RepID=UPI0009895672|nr:hypothetical protein [Salinivibrio proteolyticus]OOF24024.1 hypothetical protein BZJ19_11640 [Salinivibrio proteolyticus]